MHVDKIKSPILLLQGSEDPIVPKGQSEKMYESLIKKGIPTAYLLFEGEAHGFHDSNHIIRALEAELLFYQTLFQIPIDDTLDPILIR